MFRSGRLVIPSGKYVQRVASELGLLSAKPAPTSETEAHRRKLEDQQFSLSTVDASRFRSMACCLLYVAHDMGEIQHGVRELTCDLREPTTASIARLKRVARYLLGTTDEGIWFAYGGDLFKASYIDRHGLGRLQDNQKVMRLYCCEVWRMHSICWH